jgi:phage terminase small subunit
LCFGEEVGRVAELTEQQERFCLEYVKDFNATQAAIRAKYSPNTATPQSSRLLTNVNIQKRLTQLTQKHALRHEITVDRILQELAFIAFFDIRDLFNNDGTLKAIHELDEKTARALAAVDVEATKDYASESKQIREYIKKFKALDKKGALELLGKHLGMFAELIRIEDATTGFGKWLEGLYNALSEEGQAIYEQYATGNPLNLDEYSFRGSWKKQGENLFN